MNRKLVLILVLVAVLALAVGCGGDYEIVCCKVVKGWLGGEDYACKTVSNDTGICPESYPILGGVLISP